MEHCESPLHNHQLLHRSPFNLHDAEQRLAHLPINDQLGRSRLPGGCMYWLYTLRGATKSRNREPANQSQTASMKTFLNHACTQWLNIMRPLCLMSMRCAHHKPCPDFPCGCSH